MSMEIVGITGAKRQSQHKANPYGHVRKVIDDNPDATQNERREKSNAIVRAAIAKGDWRLFDAIHEYWFTSCHNNLSKPDHPRQSSYQERKEAAEQAEERIAPSVELAKARIRKMVLLDTVILSNGKPLREATGKDCTKNGGWLSKIGAKIKPNDVVGNVLSETAVRKFFR